MDELAKRFADLTTQYGPNVVDAARAAAQMEAYSTLAGSLIAFAFGVALLLAGRVCLRKYPDWDDDDWTLPPRFIGWACVVIAALPIAVGAWNWIDPWTWATISHPDLWIAHKILHI